jgi:hypothetical protein
MCSSWKRARSSTRREEAFSYGQITPPYSPMRMPCLRNSLAPPLRETQTQARISLWATQRLLATYIFAVFLSLPILTLYYCHLSTPISLYLQQFGNHLIMSGIKSLYEGITISYPKKDKASVLKPIATSTDNNPVFTSFFLFNLLNFLCVVKFC